MKLRLILFSIPAVICLVSMLHIAFFSSAPGNIRLIFCLAFCIPLILAAAVYFNPGYFWEVLHG